MMQYDKITQAEYKSVTIYALIDVLSRVIHYFILVLTYLIINNIEYIHYSLYTYYTHAVQSCNNEIH